MKVARAGTLLTHQSYVDLHCYMCRLLGIQSAAGACTPSASLPAGDRPSSRTSCGSGQQRVRPPAGPSRSGRSPHATRGQQQLLFAADPGADAAATSPRLSHHCESPTVAGSLLGGSLAAWLPGRQQQPDGSACPQHDGGHHTLPSCCQAHMRLALSGMQM